MTSSKAFDASTYECGPATDAVRRLLTDYAAIDWFVPPTVDEARARAFMHRHHARGRDVAPDLFAPHLVVEHASGGAREMHDWCERVRLNPPRGWDWKYGVLKPLTKRHSEAHGWHMAALPPPTNPLVAAGRLFLTLPGGHSVWNVPLPPVTLPTTPADAEARRVHEALRFFKGYCDIDLFEALEWQLAESECPLSENPFVPLLELYATAHYPFHLSADRVVLFRFDAPV